MRTTLHAPVRLALAGLGDVALQHKQAIDLCREAKLVGAWTRNPAKLAELAGQWQVQPYSTYDDLLADDSVQVVDITVADALHYDLAIRALAAGKHVIIEKPVAESAERVAELKAAANRADLHCLPVHNYAYRPAMLQAKKLVDEGRLGTVTLGFFSETMQMPEQWATHYHGVLVTAMYHLIYASLMLMGRPCRVFAQQASLHYDQCRDDDLTTVQLQYPNGSMAILVGNWAADDLTTHSWFSLYKLLGTKGGINIDGQEALVLKKSGWGSYQWPDYEDTFMHMMDYFVNRCLLGGEPPLSGLDEAIATTNIINCAQTSARRQAAVDFPQSP
jgi:predicted dehydrogenase